MNENPALRAVFLDSVVAMILSSPDILDMNSSHFMIIQTQFSRLDTASLAHSEDSSIPRSFHKSKAKALSVSQTDQQLLVLQPTILLPIVKNWDLAPIYLDLI